tara:strand:+ start:225 stop:515 length:291 start_codon:yes stop_codon:yes gene_type:complete
MSRGNETQLGRMHGLLTKYYINRLEAEMTEEEQGELDDLMLGLSPAELTAMNNFLKQNDITCAIEDSEDMSDLAKALDNKRKRGKAKLADVTSITG